MDWRLGISDPDACPVPAPAERHHAAIQTTALEVDAVPARLLPETARVEATGHLLVGGVDLVDLSEAVGTPVFVYDEQHLRNRCRQARAAFGNGAAYASKAFLCRAMASLVDQEGMMIDVASGGEMYIALSAGVPPDRLVLHGSNKSAGELTMAVALGVGRVVVDSFDEIDLLERIAKQFTDTKLMALIRVNPGIDPGTHAAVATGQEDSKFGFSVSSGAARVAIERLQRANSPVDLVGLHAHIGSQVIDLSTMERIVHVLAPLLLESGLGELCVGGGLGVAYTAVDEDAPSFAAWAQTVRRACRRAGLPPSIRVTAEPGRSIAASGAITLYTIGTIKPVGTRRSESTNSSIEDGGTYVSVDGGMSDNPRPALYGSRYEAFLPRETSARRPFAVTVVGKHCESGDVLVRNAHLPRDVTVGDVLATPVTGAYCHSMGSSYNKLLRPPVVFVNDGNYRVVARRETYRDLLRFDV